VSSRCGGPLHSSMVRVTYPVMLTPFQQFLNRFGLHCSTVEDEEGFGRGYLLRTVRESQMFIVVSALFVYGFFVWDKLIDPVHYETAQAIRGLAVAPTMVALAGMLFTNWGKRHFEALILTMLLMVMAGLAAVYGVLDRGYEYAALGFTMALLGATAMFPLRSRYLIIASILSLVIIITGHLWADNARPGWLVVNVMAGIGSISFGTLSAYIRERGARFAFRTQKELLQSRDRIDELLHSMLPREIVTRIQAGETLIADSHGEVSIIFADLVGFTELSRRITPGHLVKLLNNLFSKFDLEAERLGIERIKTIGDAYMAIGGLARGAEGQDHAENAGHLAFAMQAAVARLKEEMGYPINIRVGIHVGPVVAGVIGVKRPAYDAWGEGVNLASRIESRATPGTILVSESAYWRLRPAFELEPEADMELKGIGLAKVYSLVAVRPERKADLITLLQPQASP
jgi:adenylate cyclase